MFMTIDWEGLTPVEKKMFGDTIAETSTQSDINSLISSFE